MVWSMLQCQGPSYQPFSPGILSSVQEWPLKCLTVGQLEAGTFVRRETLSCLMLWLTVTTLKQERSY